MQTQNLANRCGTESYESRIGASTTSRFGIEPPDAYGDRLRLGFILFQALGEHTQSQRLRFRHRLVGRLAVREHARKLRNFGYPAAVLFPFVLYREVR